MKKYLFLSIVIVLGFMREAHGASCVAKNGCKINKKGQACYFNLDTTGTCTQVCVAPTDFYGADDDCVS